MSDKPSYRFFSGMFLFMLVFNVSVAQGFPMENIERALKVGDVKMLASYFGNSVDITINNSQSTYSRVQAQMVLRNFFNKNLVRDFDLEHTGNSATSNATFTIGSLMTASGKYKVYMYMKQKDNLSVLQEIRIEK